MASEGYTERNLGDTLNVEENGQAIRNVDIAQDASALPPLLLPPHRKKFWLRVGIVAAIMDLGVMPIAYFYAFHYGAKLTLQINFAIITGVLGLFCFLHYSLRSFRLFFKKKLAVWGPIGWTKWGMMEWLHINIAMVIFVVETPLVVGTAPHHPILRLCAISVAAASYYLGFLFILTSILTSMRRPLPFNMSSVPKGSPWRPALHGIVEDWGAVEMGGKKPFRASLLRRYEASSMFRRMLQVLSWCWGIGFLLTAIGTTVAVALLDEGPLFGVGWGLPFVCWGIMAVITRPFVRRSMRQEQEMWRKDSRPESFEVQRTNGS